MLHPSDVRSESVEARETGRLEAFSDGVFAIAVTLLVLDLKVPRAEELPAGIDLWHYLIGQWPGFLAYLASFSTILIMWVNHHRLFGHIRRTNDPFMFLNGLLLLFISFVPYPTSLLAEHFEHEYALTAMAIYSANLFITAILFNLLWRYAAYKNRLLDQKSDPAFVRGITRQYSFGPPLYFLAFVLSFISVDASFAMCFALAVFFALTGLLSRGVFAQARSASPMSGMTKLEE